MFEILNLDLLLLGISSASIAILGFIAFFSNPKNLTNRNFLYLSFATIFYTITNYLSSNKDVSVTTLWLIRITLFFAIWHTFSIFNFFYSFPENNSLKKKKYLFLILPLVIFTSVLTLTPFVIRYIEPPLLEGQLVNIVGGPGIYIFGFISSLLIFGGVGVLLIKTMLSIGQEKKILRIILIGASITFPSFIIFNFILPSIFKDTRFVPYGSLFMLPFIGFTFYAILKHHLLNIKVISTEILTFVLAIITIIEVVVARDPMILAFRSFVFVLVLIFGILLIKSVRNEVEQREKLEKITKELELANKKLGVVNKNLNVANEKLEDVNEQLKKLDKAKSEFISVASHQLRTPLTIIKGYVSMALDGSFGKITEKIRVQLVKVFAANERLVVLVDDLLNISRIESGRQNYEFKDNDLFSIISEITDNMNQKAIEKGLTLTLEKPKKALPKVFCDGMRLHEVMMNYVSNSIKYTRKGNVWVSLKAEPKGMITFSVKDTGMGITKENMDSLFKKFSRGKGTYLVQTEGTGLGLYVAKKIVEVHEGKVWAESQGEGKGATFYFQIPVKGPKKLPETNVDTQKISSS